MSKSTPQTTSTVSLTVAGVTYTATASTRNEALALLNQQLTDNPFSWVLDETPTDEAPASKHHGTAGYAKRS